MKRSIFFFIQTICCTISLAQEILYCNGFNQLCGRRYNEVAYPATHNGHSYKESDVHNQDVPLKEQFERGIRATKLHVWYDQTAEGKQVPFVCHGIDKALLYNPPTDTILEQVPFIFRSFFRTILEKADPFKPLVVDAFLHSYGTDNSTGAIPFRHCILDPARQPLQAALRDIHDFLARHNSEIVTVILEDHTRNLEALASDFKKADLIGYLHIQDIDKPWPTLQEMINTNKRLVVFLHGDSDLSYTKYPWMHYIWDYAWDTKWDFKDVGSFKNYASDTIPHRGKEAFKKRKSSPHNKIFIVHHFITDVIGGNKQHAAKANRKVVLTNRLQRLQKQAGHIPNIVQVDFFQYPSRDIFEAINELNGVH